MRKIIKMHERERSVPDQSFIEFNLFHMHLLWVIWVSECWGFIPFRQPRPYSEPIHPFNDFDNTFVSWIEVKQGQK